MHFALDDELEILRSMSRKLTNDKFRPTAADWDRKAEAPLPNLKDLGEAGLAGITVSEDYGGAGCSILHAVIATEEVSRACPVTAAFILANCTTTELLQNFGSEALKQMYLPRLAAGEILGAWAMTEPEAGSAASEMRTKAVEDGDHYVINGQKCFITRAAIANFFTVFARIGDDPGSKAIAAFVVDADTDGLSIGALDYHMGLRGGASAEVLFENCRVHKDTMIVPPGSFGKIMRGLNQARVLNPALCLGIATEALELSAAYMQERKAFGREIAKFQGLQWMLADMQVKVDAMRLLIYRAAAALADGNADAPHQAAIAKLYAGEAAFEVCNSAMQLHGGYGYSSEFPLERMLRDVRAFQLGGGTNEILRSRVAAGTFDRVGNLSAI